MKKLSQLLLVSIVTVSSLLPSLVRASDEDNMAMLNSIKGRIACDPTALSAARFITAYAGLALSSLTLDDEAQRAIDDAMIEKIKSDKTCADYDATYALVLARAKAIDPELSKSLESPEAQAEVKELAAYLLQK